MKCFAMRFGFAIVLGSVFVPSLHAQAPGARPLVTVRDVMEKTIAPATNTLWNVPEKPTAEDWVALEEAAVTLLVAANVVAAGGTAPADAERVKQPEWQAFNEAMIQAGFAALKAVRAKDADALLASGDVLYPPCEACHQRFHPDIAGAQ